MHVNNSGSLVKIGPAAVEAAHLIDRLDRLSRSGVNVDRSSTPRNEKRRYLARTNSLSRTPAYYLGSTRGIVAQTLIALELKSFARRTQSLHERRSVDLELTPRDKLALKDAVAGDGPRPRCERRQRDRQPRGDVTRSPGSRSRA